MENNLRNALKLHKALLEAVINRLVQLEEILLRTDGVNGRDRETLKRLRAGRVCGTTPPDASPDEALWRSPHSCVDEGNGIPQK
jgi:hypothetical protein